MGFATQIARYLPEAPRDDTDLNGTRFMLGEGLGFYNRTSTASLTAGFQDVAIRDAHPQFGVALTLGGR